MALYLQVPFSEKVCRYNEILSGISAGGPTGSKKKQKRETSRQIWI